jgi:hypothetical protein
MVLKSPTGDPQVSHMLSHGAFIFLWISCAYFFVAMSQLPLNRLFWAVRFGLFAYNGLPTFAVANDCWFRARRHTMRPFFLPVRFNSIT